jgi:hypothetical protein
LLEEPFAMFDDEKFLLVVDVFPVENGCVSLGLKCGGRGSLNINTKNPRR